MPSATSTSRDTASIPGTRPRPHRARAQHIARAELASLDARVRGWGSHAAKKASANDKENLMELKLVDIDDRLIHGQVATAWIPDYGIESAIIVSDKVPNDPAVELLKNY